jgi:hypothetical protein
MAPIRIFPELKAQIETAYAGYATADPVTTRGVVRVSTRLVENCRSEGDLESHTVVCDEPADRGGTGRGPAPLYYFLASLGF